MKLPRRSANDSTAVRGRRPSRKDLGYTYDVLGELGRAELHLRRAVELDRQSLGPDHPRTIAAEVELANVLKRQGQYEESAGLLKRAIDYYRESNGPDAPHSLNATRFLAQLYSAKGRHAEAIAILEDVLKRSRETYGPEREITVGIMNVLGLAYQNADRPQDALKLHQEALRIRTAKLGEESPITLLAMHNLAAALEEAGRWREAAKLFEKELQAAKIKFGAESRHTLQVMRMLGYAYHLSGRIPDAIAMTFASRPDSRKRSMERTTSIRWPAPPVCRGIDREPAAQGRHSLARRHAQTEADRARFRASFHAEDDGLAGLRLIEALARFRRPSISSRKS